jgi:WD40 repeat protein
MFELLNKQLVRIRIENLHHRLQTMSANSSNVFATNGRTLYVISMDDPSLVRRFDSDLPASYENLCMTADHQTVVWYHDKGERSFHLQNYTFSDTPVAPGSSCGVVLGDHLWSLNGKQIVKRSLKSGTTKAFATSSAFRHIAHQANAIIAWGDQSLIRLSESGQVVAEIEVRPTKKLKFADFVDSSLQSYLMHDGALEVHDTDKQTIRYYDTSSFLKPDKVNVFRARKYVAALASDKQLRILQLLDADK